MKNKVKSGAFGNNKRAILAFVGLCIYMFTVYGFIVYSYGLLIPAVSTTQNISLTEMSFTYTIRLIVGTLATQIGFKIMPRFPSRIYFCIISIALCGIYFLYSVSSTFGHFLTLAVIAGMVLGCSTYIMIPLMCNEWFINPAIMLGIATACSGAGGVIISPFLSNMISGIGWQASTRIIAIFVAVILIPISLFMIQYSPKKLGMEQVPGLKSKKVREEVRLFQPVTTRKRTILIIICVIMFIACGLTLIPALYPSMMETKGISSADTGTLLSFMQIGNVVAPLLVGMLASKIGLKKSILIFLSIGFVGVLFTMMLPSNYFILIGTAGALFACCRIDGVAMPMVVREIFGKESYGKIFPKIQLIFYLTTAFIVTIYGKIYDAYGSYEPVYYIIMVGIVITAISCLISYRMVGKKGFAKKNGGIEKDYHN